MPSEMKILLLIVIIYSLVVFILVFIYYLILFFKLRRNEREIIDVKRKLNILLQNSDLILPENNALPNQEPISIQDTIVDNQVRESGNEASFKNAIKNSKRHLSLETISYQSEKEIKPVPKPEKEEDIIASDNTEDLKDKIIDMLDQFDSPISYDNFSKSLNEDSSFAGKHNLAFHLIDQLVDEDKIEVHFVGGKLLINLK